MEYVLDNLVFGVTEVSDGVLRCMDDDWDDEDDDDLDDDDWDDDDWDDDVWDDDDDEE